MGRASWLWVGMGGLACSPEPALRWETTRAACGLDPVELLPFEALLPAEDGGFNELAVPPGCGERIVRDFGGDPVALVAEIGDAPDLAVQLEEERLGVRAFTGLGAIVRSAYWLLGSDLGTLHTFVDLEVPFVSDYWQDHFADFAVGVGLPSDASMSQVFYDHAVVRFKRLVFQAPEAPAQSASAVQWWTRTLEVPREVDLDFDWTFDRTHPLDDIGLIVHESAHAVQWGKRHVRCAAGDLLRGCDRDLRGANGAGYAAIWAQVHAATRGKGCRELTPAGELGRWGQLLIQVDWERSILDLEVPRSVLHLCAPL
ncbi:MAG: hypothetical protein KTR31_29835 [Myxococcales bacterium]|nr:hypothetical protein [Myxococcales bacterium]